MMPDKPATLVHAGRVIADAIPAATLVLFRERAGAAPEILMAERAAAMVFAGGATVFPGGRIDTGDALLVPADAADPDDMVARIAAIRETLEEAGIAVAIDPVPDAAATAAMRCALHAGEPLAAVLGDRRLLLDRLVPFARWCPPARGERRVFDTRFYIALAEGDAPEPVADAGETVRVRWSTALDTLAAADRGEVAVIFPTRRNLERIASFADFGEALADCARHPPAMICPWIEDRDGVATLCIPPDMGYPVTGEALATVRRG